MLITRTILTYFWNNRSTFTLELYNMFIQEVNNSFSYTKLIKTSYLNITALNKNIHLIKNPDYNKSQKTKTKQKALLNRIYLSSAVSRCTSPEFLDFDQLLQLLWTRNQKLNFSNKNPQIRIGFEEEILVLHSIR